jgi:cyclopropane-fatty-acyl-phospholipid synthase
MTRPAATAHHRSSPWEKAFLKAVASLPHGLLRLHLPGGKELVFGTPGTGPDADMEVLDPSFFRRCFLYGDIGLAESYMEGLWETSSIERVIAWAILNIEEVPGRTGRGGSVPLNLLQAVNRLRHLLRPNSLTVSRRNIAEHYDLGNDFYRLWLDPTMTYSSALFTAPEQTLESAQTAKYERLCRMMRLSPGDHLLEIGCGWGGMAEHAARSRGCRVTSITISKEQQRFAKERIARAGLSDRVEIVLEDYRKIRGRFDKIVSIEMMEALGDRYLPVFCARLHELLQPEGIVALQYITVPDSRHRNLRRGVDFIQKHIFPGSLLLSVGRVNEALNATGDLFLHDLKDMGHSYARTLHCWWETFNARAGEVKALGFDERFLRKWNYYLQYCEAAFATRNISVVQAVYTRPNNPRLT